jgi:hypothetical protein
MDYFQETILPTWRVFIKAIKQSNPFREAWIEVTTAKYGKMICLQHDSPTRWSSTISMLAKTVDVKDAVLEMYAKAPEKQRVCYYYCFYLLIFKGKGSFMAFE